VEEAGVGVYTFTCECGSKVTAVGKEGKCRSCGLMYRVVWPDPDPKPAREGVTVSDRYEEGEEKRDL
jgi:hypothetical protein